MSFVSDMPDLTERGIVLFREVVRHYINDGQPVGSRKLVKDADLQLSPATVRNVMADLEDMGLLSSPHTSAGRVPTAKGYRLFVDLLMQGKSLDCSEKEQIIRGFERESSGSESELLDGVGDLLSNITNFAGVIMVQRSPPVKIRRIEFVGLSENRILVILIANDQEIQNRIVHASRVFSAAELQCASNHINSLLEDMDWEALGRKLRRELEQMRQDVNKLMCQAIDLAEDMVESRSSAGEQLLLSGQMNLMNVEDLRDVEKLRRLFESFNQKRDILQLLEKAIHARGMFIFIGEEAGCNALDDCSLVSSPYGKDEAPLGVVGVIGPTRMEYERIIPIVEVTAEMLSRSLNMES